MDKNKYIFTSERLGFRNWVATDEQKMVEINMDPKVMEFFPKIPSKQETKEFIMRMQKQFAEKGFCYFAVDKLIDNSYIGFIGLSEQNYKSDFTPCIDIGWRLAQSEWGKGYATEGAKRCLDYAFNTLNLENIKSVCPIVNHKSEHVMKKLGMTKLKTFDHPLLTEYKTLQKCVLYEIEKN